VLLSTHDSGGGVEPLVALAVRLRALGAGVLMCAAPDCGERLAEVGVPLVAAGARSVAEKLGIHGAAAAARLLVGAISRERPPLSA
jgi:hypothetical protein